MDAPHRYEMSLKKDGLFINLSSDDVYFISKQMDKWFRILLDDSYVPVSLPKPAPVVASVPPVVSEATVPDIALQATAPDVPSTDLAGTVSAPVAAPPVEATSASSPLPIVPAAVTPELPQSPEPVRAAQAAPPVSPAPSPAPLASAPELASPLSTPEVTPLPTTPAPPLETLDSFAPVSAMPPVESASPVAPPALSVVPPLVSSPSPGEPPKDDFESVMDTVMRDLEAPPPPLPTTPVIETLYEQSSVPAATPMNLDLVNSLADLCDQAQPGSSEDYLLLASYYLSQVESQACFSLKRINANLVKSGLTPVNHSALESVLSKGYLCMVPDLSGTAEVSEYSMTDEGLAFINQLF